MATLSQATLDAIAAAVTAALDAREATTVQPSTAAASAHWKSRDVACPAAKPCERTFRTVKGAAWHAANVKHA